MMIGLYIHVVKILVALLGRWRSSNERSNCWKYRSTGSEKDWARSHDGSFDLAHKSVHGSVQAECFTDDFRVQGKSLQIIQF